MAKRSEEASHLADKLDWNEAIKDMQAAADFMRVSTGKVGAVGFCMGGGLAVRVTYTQAKHLIYAHTQT